MCSRPAEGWRTPCGAQRIQQMHICKSTCDLACVVFGLIDHPSSPQGVKTISMCKCLQEWSGRETSMDRHIKANAVQE